MARRVVVVLLLLVAMATVAVAVNRPEEGQRLETRQELDGPATAACETFEAEADRIRTGQLTGVPLYGVLQDTYDDARLSVTDGFAQRVAELNSTAINGDLEQLRRDVLGLQLTCQQRRG